MRKMKFSGYMKTRGNGGMNIHVPKTAGLN